MILTNQTVVKFSSEYYKLFDNLCFRAKNLYNAALYKVRQAYFEYEAVMSYNSLDKVFKRERSNEREFPDDYAEMPTASAAQGTLKLVMQNWNSFWAAAKSYNLNPEKFLGKPKMPGYLHKTKGRSAVFLTNQNVKLRGGVMQFPKSFDGFSIPFGIDDVNGALQIVKKVFPKAKSDGIWAFGQPVRVGIT